MYGVCDFCLFMAKSLFSSLWLFQKLWGKPQVLNKKSAIPLSLYVELRDFFTGRVSVQEMEGFLKKLNSIPIHRENMNIRTVRIILNKIKDG